MISYIKYNLVQYYEYCIIIEVSLQSLNPLREIADLLINPNADILIEMQESLLQEN